LQLAPGAAIVRDPGGKGLSNVASRSFGVLDVARQGNTIAVLVVDGTVASSGSSVSFYDLLISRDLGVTWAPPIPIPAWPTGTALQPDPIPEGVVLAPVTGGGVRAFIAHRYYYSFNSSERTLRELSLTTGRFLANPGLDDWLLTDQFVQRGTTAAGFWSATTSTACTPQPYCSSLEWYSVALSTATPTNKGLLTSQARAYPGSWNTGNAVTWVSAQPEGAQLCVYRVTPSSSMTPSRTCYASSLFAPEIGTPAASIEVVNSSRGPILVGYTPRASDGHVMAAALEPSPISLDLGKIPQLTRDPGIHDRYGSFLLGSSQGLQTGASMLDVTTTGVDQIGGVPPTPCAAGACGTGSVDLAWLQVLPGGEALAFYVVETGSWSSGPSGTQTTSHPLLVTLKATLTRTPLGGTPPSLAANAAPGRLNACTAMSSCFGTTRQSCVDFFSPKPGIPLPPNRNQLLTAYTSGCAVLGPLWPEAALPGTAGCTSGCRGNVAVTCSGTTVATATDCGRYWSTCGVAAGTGTLGCGDGSPSLPCNACSANGSAVTCDRPVPTALGCVQLNSTCSVTAAGPVCGPLPACGNQPSCSGDTLTTCVNGTLRATYCGDLGLTCTTAGGGACESLSPHAACVAGTFAETCDGTKALYCSGGSLLSSDCALLGFARCTVVSGEARCAK